MDKHQNFVGGKWVDAVDGATQLTLTQAVAAGDAGTGAYKLAAGLGNNFVPPWGPWSVLTCSDCHADAPSD